MKLRASFLLPILLLTLFIGCTSIKNITSKYSPFTTRKKVVESGNKGEGRREEGEGGRRNTVDSSQLTVNRQTVNCYPPTHNA